MAEPGDVDPSERVACVVASFPKSGRTWLASMYAFYVIYALAGEKAEKVASRYGFVYRPERHRRIVNLLAGQDRVPRLGFTHALPPGKPYYALGVSLDKVRVDADALVLLVRDPRDVVVSYFHHAHGRGPRGKDSVGLPSDVGISEFLRSETMGVRAAVQYMNQVADRGPELFERFEVIAYEDMLTDPGAALVRVLELACASTIDAEAVSRAVEQTRFDRMQAAERAVHERAQRAPEDRVLRVRSGRQGSAKDELSSTDLAYLDEVIDRRLAPAFARYRTSSLTAAEAQTGDVVP